MILYVYAPKPMIPSESRFPSLIRPAPLMFLIFSRRPSGDLAHFEKTQCQLWILQSPPVIRSLLRSLSKFNNPYRIRMYAILMVTFTINICQMLAFFFTISIDYPEYFNQMLTFMSHLFTIFAKC